ncbi:Pimeloyl-ACP methyl ester carboxylesterase [Devosia enhydra]|uniref:Pimeloyl-ACP methyl ester carboxylesterase n=1 Tax=Devosia enhydra TaxID=665118 RepID=A0A1K2I122_9HYPH|nr:alpha/beta hydrolase [Devosia enhydra]SFZ86024.1 Pimeloyl-ACP methyl ester carboxylesterase [Devosia enhydra]
MPEPLVLLPGLQADHRSWVNQIRHFEPTRQVIVPQRHQQCDTIPAMCARVHEQLPERFHLVAWSMGGYVAMQLLPRLTGRLLSLTLISTSARPEDPASTARRMEILALAERDGMAASNRRTMTQACVDFDAVDPDIRAGLRDAAVELGVDAYRGQQKAIINRPDSRSLLKLVDCPTLVLVGDRDTVTPPECAREIHEAIVGSRLIIIENCGHCAPLEYPELTNRLLSDWCSGAVEYGLQTLGRLG